MSLPLIFKRGFVVRALPRIPDPLKTSTKATTWDVAPGVTFTHRPPPTAPTPFSLTDAPASPLLLLGKRQRTTTALSTSEDVPLPPALHKPRPPPVTITDEQVAEIRRMRSEDPFGKSASAIAKEYGITPAYVRYLAPLRNADRKWALAQDLEKEGREKWGYRKRLIRETRQKRRDYWSMAPQQ